MPNQTTSAEEFGYKASNLGEDAASAASEAGATLRDKAREYIGEGRVHDLADAAAERVSATTDYFRNTDPRRMRSDVEKLVRSNPGPAMLIAVTVGFLIGRALNRH